MRRSRVLVALLTAAMLAACGGTEVEVGGTGSPSPTGATGVSQTAASAAALGLCDVRAQAGDAETAGATFDDRVHETIHAIAAAVQGADPEVAARLLEAKERVESDLADGAPEQELGADVDRLIDELAAATEALGLDPTDCAT
jgi:hypothetical protein